MRFEPYIEKYQSFIFEFDDVLYPEKDYHLQVYYLFSQFIEYAEQKDATQILEYMKVTFAEEGNEHIFERTAAQFGLDEKYKINFDLLVQSVKLPLKLLLFDEMLRFLKSLAEAGKQVFLLVSGDAVMQLNKIKQTEWNGLDSSLIVYFEEEMEVNSIESHLSTIVEKHSLNLHETVFIGRLNQEIAADRFDGIQYLDAAKLLT